MSRAMRHLGVLLLVSCVLALLPIPGLFWWWAWVMSLPDVWGGLVVVVLVPLVSNWQGRWRGHDASSKLPVAVLCAAAVTYVPFVHVSLALLIAANALVVSPRRFAPYLMVMCAALMLVSGEILARDDELGVPLAPHGDWAAALRWNLWIYVHMGLVATYALLFAWRCRKEPDA